MGAVKDILKKRAKNRARLEKEAPNLYNGFNELMKHYYSRGALERKYKESMAVAFSVATQCVPCLANHNTNAIEAGATKEKVVEAAVTGIEFGVGPSFVVIRDNLLDFLDEIESSRKSSNRR